MAMDRLLQCRQSIIFCKNIAKQGYTVPDILRLWSHQPPLWPYEFGLTGWVQWHLEHQSWSIPIAEVSIYIPAAEAYILYLKLAYSPRHLWGCYGYWKMFLWVLMALHSLRLVMTTCEFWKNSNDVAPRGHLVLLASTQSWWRQHCEVPHKVLIDLFDSYFGPVPDTSDMIFLFILLYSYLNMFGESYMHDWNIYTDKWEGIKD